MSSTALFADLLYFSLDQFVLSKRTFSKAKKISSMIPVHTVLMLWLNVTQLSSCTNRKNTFCTRTYTTIKYRATFWPFLFSKEYFFLRYAASYLRASLRAPSALVHDSVWSVKDPQEAYFRSWHQEGGRGDEAAVSQLARVALLRMPQLCQSP